MGIGQRPYYDGLPQHLIAHSWWNLLEQKSNVNLLFDIRARLVDPGVLD